MQIKNNIGRAFNCIGSVSALSFLVACQFNDSDAAIAEAPATVVATGSPQLVVPPPEPEVVAPPLPTAPIATVPAPVPAPAPVLCDPRKGGPLRTSVYVGNDAAAVAAAERWLGRDLDAFQVFIGAASWADWMGSMPWLANLFRDVDAQPLWSLPLIPRGATLEAAAAGEYDDKYLQMAQQLLAASGDDAQIYVRLGWEFNLRDGFPWAAHNKEDAYVAAFRNVVDAFRSVSNRFVFEWTPNIGDMGMNPETAYPGDSYVDVIGIDFYYNNAWDSKDPKVAWNYFVTEKYGLQWQQDFAAARGKPTAIGEWGLNYDSAEFVTLAEKWFEDHKLLYQNYWNSNAAFNGKLSDGQYPRAAAAFEQAFGADPYNGPISIPCRN